VTHRFDGRQCHVISDSWLNREGFQVALVTLTELRYLCACAESQQATTTCVYTACHSRNGPNFGRVFLILDFRLSPWFQYCIISSGYFPGVKL